MNQTQKRIAEKVLKSRYSDLSMAVSNMLNDNFEDIWPVPPGYMARDFTPEHFDEWYNDHFAGKRLPDGLKEALRELRKVIVRRTKIVANAKQKMRDATTVVDEQRDEVVEIINTANEGTKERNSAIREAGKAVKRQLSAELDDKLVALWLDGEGDELESFRACLPAPEHLRDLAEQASLKVKALPQFSSLAEQF